MESPLNSADMPCNDNVAPTHFDLVIIGSGPAALALITRILESRPAALYTEEEHAHLHWLRREESASSRRRPLLQLKRTGRGKEKVIGGVYDAAPDKCGCNGGMRILVVDRLGGWLANWDRLFQAYEIDYLRSPMFFHPSPADNDSLLAYAERNGRTRTRYSSVKEQPSTTGEGVGRHSNVDLVEIPGCVGKEVSKHKQKQKRKEKSHRLPLGPAVDERDRKDYFTPSSKLFRDFVNEDLVHRYGLHNDGKEWQTAKEALKGEEEEEEEDQRITLVKGVVADMTWQSREGFSLRLDCGTHIGAHAVVCAMGAGATPTIPSFLKSRVTSLLPPTSGPGWCHSAMLGLQDRSVPPACLLEKEKRGKKSTLVVVGGGLTSAQICDVAIRRGITNVVLIMRGYMKIKPFDVGLEWIGKYANLEQMQFWQEDDLKERHRMLLDARKGGSITPAYAEFLKRYQKQDRLQIFDCTNVVGAVWRAGEEEEYDADTSDGGHWQLDLERHERDKADVTTTKTLHHLQADYIITATGSSPHFSKVPFLANIIKQHGIPEYGGLPALSDNLQYGSIPLFCTGAFSALQIGPGAFNLAGMRAAADRIAVRLQELAIGKDDNYQELLISTTPSPPLSHYTHFGFHSLSVEG